MRKNSRKKILFRYLAALAYDCLVLTALFFCFTMTCLLINHGQAIPAATRWYQFALLLIAFNYYVFSICKGGQTLGLRAWHLQVLSEGRKPNFFQASCRFFLLLPLIMIALLSLQSPGKLINQWTKTSLCFTERSKDAT